MPSDFVAEIDKRLAKLGIEAEGPNAPSVAKLTASVDRTLARMFPESAEQQLTADDITRQLGDADQQALPPVAKESVEARVAYEMAFGIADGLTKNVPVAARVGTGLSRHIALAATFVPNLPLLRQSLTIVDRIAGEKPGTFSQFIRATGAGVAEGLSPPETFGEQVLEGVGQAAPVMLSGGAGGVAGAAVGGGRLVAGAGAIVGGAAAQYPSSHASAEQHYRSELFLRNLDRIQAGDGDRLEEYDEAAAFGYAWKAAAAESAIEGFFNLGLYGAGRAVSRAAFGPGGLRAVQEGAGQAAQQARRIRGTRGLAAVAGQEARDQAKATATAIAKWTATSGSGRIMSAAGGLAAGAVTEGLEEVASDYLRAKIGRATGAVPDARVTPEAAAESFLVGAGAGFILTGAVASTGATKSILSARAEAKRLREQIAAIRSVQRDVDVLEQTAARLQRLGPAERAEEALAWVDRVKQAERDAKQAGMHAEDAARRVAHARRTEAPIDELEALEAAMDDAVRLFRGELARADTARGILRVAETMGGADVESGPQSVRSPEESMEAFGVVRASRRRLSAAEKAVEADAARLGYTVRFYDAPPVQEGTPDGGASPSVPPAFYDWRSPGTVYVRQGQGQSRRVLGALVLHEIVHDVQWYAPEVFAEVRGLLGPRATVMAGLEYARQGMGVQDVAGLHAGDLAAIALLAGPRSQASIDPELQAEASRGLARIETEGTARAVEAGAEASGALAPGGLAAIDRALARVGVAGAEGKAAVRLLSLLRRRARDRAPASGSAPNLDAVRETTGRSRGLEQAEIRVADLIAAADEVLESVGAGRPAGRVRADRRDDGAVEAVADEAAPEATPKQPAADRPQEARGDSGQPPRGRDEGEEPDDVDPTASDRRETDPAFAEALEAVRAESRSQVARLQRTVLELREAARTVLELREAVEAERVGAWTEARRFLEDEMVRLRSDYRTKAKARRDAELSLRLVAADIASLLGQSDQGGLARRIAQATTFNRVVKLADVVVLRLARREYTESTDRFRAVERRLAGRKLPTDVREQVEAIFDAAKPAIYAPNENGEPGLKIRSTGAVDYHRRAAIADDAVEQALEHYEAFRADWKASRDARNERLRQIADELDEALASRPATTPAAGSSEAEGTGRKRDFLHRQAGDFDSLARLVDGRKNGPLRRMVRGLKRAESRMQLRTRDMLARLDELAVAAGFKDLEHLRDLAGDRRGPGRTRYLRVTLAGEERRVTLGQAMKLMALDPETVGAIDRGTGVKLGDARDGATLDGVSAAEIDQVRADHAELAAFVDEAKRYREEELRRPAFAAHERLKGYSPRMVVGYEPRTRDRASFDPESVTSAGQAAAKFAENAGFTKERTGGGSAIIVGDFLDDYLQNADGSLRLAHMAEPTRDLWSVLMHPDIRAAITSRHGTATMKSLRTLLVVGAGMIPPQAPTGIDTATGLVTQSFLAVNPSTWMKVLGGGVANLGLVLSPRQLANGVTGAVRVSMEEIESRSGYLWSRNAQNATDRRSNVRDDSAAGAVLGGGLRQSGRRFIAAKDNLLLAIRGDIQGDKVGRSAATKRAALEFMRAWDPGMLSWLDQRVVKVAVASHLADVRRKRPELSRSEALDIAVRRAEETIRRTQNTSSAMDDAAITALAKSSNPLAKAIMPFSSDPLKTAARLSELSMDSGVLGAARWGVVGIANASIATVAGLAIAALRAQLSGDDEEYEQLLAAAKLERAADGETFAVQAISEVVGRTGVIGFFGSGVAEVAASAVFDRKGYSPSVDMLFVDSINELSSDALRVAESAIGGERPEGDDVGSLLMTLGQVTGMPVPLIRLLEPLFTSEDPQDAVRAQRILASMGRELTPEQRRTLARARRDIRREDWGR